MSTAHDYPAIVKQAHKFTIGETIIYTNPQGVVFDRGYKVTGYCEETHPLYKNGARYYLDFDCHWFPVKEENLSRVA